MTASRKTALLRLASSVAAVGLAFAIGAALMLAVGVDPLAVYARLAQGTLLNPYGLAQILFKATPLILAGLSVALAFKAGLFNIGAEGQMTMGGLCCALAASELRGLPAVVHIPVCLLAAMLGGALWAAPPALLKARRGAHEVITTIMMNFIAAALANYLVAVKFHEPETVHTAAGMPSSFLPRLDAFIGAFKGSPANVSLLIALTACAAVWWLLRKTAFGYEVRAAGLSPDAAATAGINVPARMAGAFVAAGALAGLGAANFVMGYKHYFEEGFCGGAGFMGIAVALAGQNNPAGIVAAALLFGALSHGTLVINALVPKDIVLAIQALVIIFVIAFDGLARRAEFSDD
ncbi:MAG: ABC transporter permease [Elusimicrobiales bacterium]